MTAKIVQMRGLKDQALAIAKAHGAKGAFIILDYGPEVRIGTNGLTFEEQLYALSVGVHYAFKFAEEEQSE
jgi:hypothetical protein